MKKFNLKEAILKNKATFFSSLTEDELEKNQPTMPTKMSYHPHGLKYQSSLEKTDANEVVIYAVDSKGKKQEINRVPKSEERTALTNIQRRYYDNDVEILSMPADEFDSMLESNLQELIKDALKNPKKENLNKDRKLSSYEKKRGAAIEKSMETNESYGSSNDFGGMGRMYYHVLEDIGGDIGHQGYYNTKEEAQQRADKLADMFPRSFFYVEASNSKNEPYNVTLEGETPIKPTTKMKKSEFKAKIKEMVISEMEKDVNYTDETAGYDFLAEMEDMLDEDEETEKDTAEAEDVTVDDTETIDTETTTEVNPDVKAVQDALTQAQAAAQKLGDPKLTDQIGNTITFFTRTHVVEKGAVNERMSLMLKKILK